MGKIRIADDVTVVEQSFLDAVRAMHLAYLGDIDRASRGEAGRRKYYLDKNVAASQRALDCVRNVQATRRGTNFDILVRCQTANEYKRLYAEQHAGHTWFIGETRDIFLKGDDADLVIGPYLVAYSAKAMKNGGIIAHFIPLWAPNDPYRPHHYAYADQDYSQPFACETQTCYGGFNTAIASMVLDRDLAALFHTAYKYISIYNGFSPLKHITDIQWIQRLKRK